MATDDGPCSLGMVTAYVAVAVPGWDLATASADFAGESHRLGRAVAARLAIEET